MIELKHDSLVFSFPEVHPSATVSIDFQRTLRIPDDDRDYPLPPGLGRFPLRLVDDLGERVPAAWLDDGGIVFPMYQSEAMWLHFSGSYDEERCVSYPFALKIATGRINAVSGLDWVPGLNREPRQDYVVVPGQPWLDGYCVEKGIIRQFVAMPLGAGYTAEEQVTGKAEHGGLQVMACPMKRKAFEKRFPVRPKRARSAETGSIMYSVQPCAPAGMGLAPGGRMKQDIYEDAFGQDEWDLEHRGSCFAHIANSLVWRQLTGANPPTPPPTSEEYTRAGLPWFTYYDEHHAAVGGSDILAKLKSVLTTGKEKGDVPLPENVSVTPQRIIALRQGLAKDQVREYEN
jgi:hypothetical protein